MREKKTRWVWAWIATAALAGTMVMASQPARADSWHLSLNGVGTVSGTNCPETFAGAMHGEDDVTGNYFGSGGLTFQYWYGDNHAAVDVPTSGYSYSMGVYTFDFTTDWSWGWEEGDDFVISPSAGTDFWCNLPYDSP